LLLQLDAVQEWRNRFLGLGGTPHRLPHDKPPPRPNKIPGFGPSNIKGTATTVSRILHRISCKPVLGLLIGRITSGHLQNAIARDITKRAWLPGEHGLEPLIGIQGRRWRLQPRS